MPFSIGINNAIILSGHNGYEPFVGSVGIADGRIAHVGVKPVGPGDAAERIDASGKILMPGLVNGHCHGDMTFARGLGDGLTLQEQNEQFSSTNWFYSLITDEDRYDSRMLTYCEALLSGTTFINENMYWGLGDRSVTAMKSVGIHGALTEDIRYDFTDTDRLLSDEDLAALTGHVRANGLVPVIGGISEEDYKELLLKQIEEKRRHANLLLTCHLAETTWRMDRIRELFNMTPIQMLHDAGWLNRHLIGSHVVWATPTDIHLLADHDVKVVNTPLCEMKIADGIAPIPDMVRAGICVSIGSDGGMWNNSNDLFREMKGMMLLHTVNSGIRSLKTTDVLDMATINGARTFGLEDDLGTIEAGKRADLILVDAEQAHLSPLRLGPHENVASTIVFSATGRDVSDVFIDGRAVVRNRQLLTVDLKTIRGRVARTSEKVARELAG